MDRLACVDVPTLRSTEPLTPAVPQTSAPEASRAARGGRLAEITDTLQRFSPAVEPAEGLAGVFWLDASGLVPLFPSLEAWAWALRAELGKQGIEAWVAVGFSRFGTYALARTAGKEVVLTRTPAKEKETVRKVPLARLDLEPELLELLAKLGVRTVGTFLRLPASGLLERFGPAAWRLHRLATDKLWAPLRPCPIEEPPEVRRVLEHPTADHTLLLSLLDEMLGELIPPIAARYRTIAGLHLMLVLETKERLLETVRPASPTCERSELTELFALRFHATHLPAAVSELVLRSDEVDRHSEQLRLSSYGARRDLEAGSRALARIRAELGEKAVVRAHVLNRHLPEAAFKWEPTTRLLPPRPRRLALRPLVRRVHERPLPLTTSSGQSDEPFIDPDAGPQLRLLGPYLVSGGWWARAGGSTEERAAVRREYYFAETSRGDLYWVYYDRGRGRWFMQGRVE